MSRCVCWLWELESFHLGHRQGGSDAMTSVHSVPEAIIGLHHIIGTMGLEKFRNFPSSPQ